MSFWSNLTIKAPAILSGLSGLSGLVATLLPQYAVPLTTATALVGILGASLHSLNPSQTEDVPNSDSVVTNTVNVVKTVAPIVAASESAKVSVTAEQIEAISKILSNQDK